MSSTQTPPVIADIEEARQRVRALQAEQKTVGLVPTMGALHAGHLSLVEASRERCDATVVTIFVNPTQFGPNEDLDQYPRTLPDDLRALAPLGVDFVFAPSAEQMYPAGASTSLVPPDIAEPLEGSLRPGHFAGVCTIVLKLFQILPADMAFFGQKDFQQAQVIQHMTRDLNLPIEIDVRPIVREADGLALSSRNRYLSVQERQAALGLSAGLREAERMVAAGETDADAIMQAMKAVMERAGIEQIEYAVVADPATLELQKQVGRPVVALIAARVGKTRLIDNCLID